MMNRETADQVIAMLRGKKPIGQIGRRALREFPELPSLGKRLGPAGAASTRRTPTRNCGERPRVKAAGGVR
jgi:hypothetical protein